MAKNTKKKTTKVKVKKKSWFKIAAPALFSNKELGETYLTAPEAAIGRELKVNLRNITGNIKDQNMYVRFKITSLNGKVLQTAVIGFELTPQYVKRAVRKRTARLDDYLTLTTKDGKEVIVKTLAVTVFKTQRSTKKSIREMIHTLLAEEMKKGSVADFVGGLVNFKIQPGMKKKLQKIFPVKEVSVRVLKLKDTKSMLKEAAPVVKEEPVAQEVASE